MNFLDEPTYNNDLKKPKMPYTFKYYPYQPLLHKAVLDGSVAKVEKYVATHGEEPLFHLDEKGDSYLHVACNNWGHNIDIVRYLIEKGLSVDAINVSGYTPLHTVSYHGHLGVAKLLIKSGANCNIQNIYGITALHRASALGILEMVKLLIPHSRKDIKNNSGETAADLAETNEIRKFIEEYVHDTLELKVPSED